MTARYLYRFISPDDNEPSLEIDITELTESERADVLAILKGQKLAEDTCLSDEIKAQVRPVSGIVLLHTCYHGENKQCEDVDA